MKEITAVTSTKEIKQTSTKDEFLQRVQSNQFYHGLRSRADVEENLVEKGDYLFRIIKSRKNELVLSIGLGANSDAKFAHLPIIFNPVTKLWELQVLFDKKGKTQMEKTTCEAVGGGGGNQGVNKKALQFASLDHLVKYYGDHPLFGVTLRIGVRRPRWLLPLNSIRFNNKIGEGYFCQVLKGKFKPNKVVAIKMLHEAENDSQQTDVEKDEGRDSIFREAQVMAKCKHRHIVSFFGVQCDVPPVMIVMEYCPGGSLDNHLQKEKEKITDGERFVYSYEIALGMRYLHFHKLVHRDIAARNCLIAANGVIKISDFGLSRAFDHIETVDVARVPLRWMAPETLRRNPVFSSKSDIWAYGILLFEIYNLGIKPWAEEEDQRKIARTIRHGPMPDLPEQAPSAIKDLIHQCWNITSAERPEFRIITKILTKMTTDNPQMKLPKPDEYSVNRLPGVYREEILTMSEDGERNIMAIGSENIHTPQAPTTAEPPTPQAPNTSEGTGSLVTVSDKAKGSSIRNSKKERTRPMRATTRDLHTSEQTGSLASEKGRSPFSDSYKERVRTFRAKRKPKTTKIE